MFTIRISPKISAKPLATMNSADANVIESSTILRKFDGSWTADPNVVVRQLETPDAPGTVAMKRTYANAKTTTPIASATGKRRQVRYELTWWRDGMRAARALIGVLVADERGGGR